MSFLIRNQRRHAGGTRASKERGHPPPPGSSSKSHLTEHENIHTGKSLLSIINVEMSLPRGNASLRIKTFILERNFLNVMNVGNLQTKGKTSVFIKSMQERNLNVVGMRKVIFRSQALLGASEVLLEINPMHGRKVRKYSMASENSHLRDAL